MNYAVMEKPDTNTDTNPDTNTELGRPRPILTDALWGFYSSLHHHVHLFFEGLFIRGIQRRKCGKFPVDVSSQLETLQSCDKMMPLIF